MSGFALRKWLEGARPAWTVSDRPIDLVHLSRQLLGDRALERELLMLFERQAGQVIARLDSEIGAADRKWRRDLSHTLTGSARAVGAMRVAEAASIYEEALFSSASDRELTVLRDALAAEVAVACRSIRELLAEG